LNNPAQICFAALFLGASALALGMLITEWLRLPLSRTEARRLGFVLGSAAFSLAIFLLNVVFLARPWAFALLGASTIATCLYRRSWRAAQPDTRPGLSRGWRWLFAVLYGFYGLFYLAHAMAPEMSPDGSAYHLGVIAQYLRQGGFGRITTNMYANLPLGVEMLFEFAFAFGRHSAAALVHWFFLMLLPLLMLSFGRRFGMIRAGATAGLLVFLSPVVGIDGSSAYVDVALGAVLFALFYVLMIWERERAPGLLIAGGILAGFAYACKLTAILAVPFAVIFVAWRMWRDRQSFLKPVLAMCVASGVLIAPWMIKNIVTVSNPLSPFLNRIFPNPYIRISFEEQYREAYRTYNGAIKSAAEIPLEVTVGGSKLNGLLGPVWLLAPVGLLALRWPMGRRALVAAFLMLLTYPSNVGTRFLLAALPFAGFAFGMVLAQWRSMAIVVVLFHALLAWPGIMKLYGHEYAWRLDKFLWKPALRLETEDSFLSRMLPGYVAAKLVNEHVPASGRVFTFNGPALAYTSREVLVAYQAALNNTLGDIFTAGMSPDYHPRRHLEFRFAESHARRVRLVQTKQSQHEWNVTELRVLGPQGEIGRNSAWRIRSSPNPWEVQLAFDNCPVTRWRSAERATPGMFIEIDFGSEMPLFGVRAEVSPDQDSEMRVEAESTPDNWRVLSDKPVVKEHPALPNARRTAMDDLKRFGVTHMVVSDDEWLAPDLLRNQKAWGVSVIGEKQGIRLYKLD
jgi:hypothetical protein